MAQFSLNQNYDIGLVPNDWHATPVSTSIENLYSFDIHVEERFQINEKIGQNLINENEELKQQIKESSFLKEKLASVYHYETKK